MGGSKLKRAVILGVTIATIAYLGIRSTLIESTQKQMDKVEYSQRDSKSAVEETQQVSIWKPWKLMFHKFYYSINCLCGISYSICVQGSKGRFLAYFVISPSFWDDLPVDLRFEEYLTCFKSSLKTHLSTLFTKNPDSYTGQKHTFPPPWESIGYVLETY